MGWETSNRRQQLPKNWATLRKQVQARANNQCEAKLNNGQRCPGRGTDCDHKNPGGDHSLNNLQWLCAWHHKRKTAGEGNQKTRKPKPPTNHPKETHPAYR